MVASRRRRSREAIDSRGSGTVAAGPRRRGAASRFAMASPDPKPPTTTSWATVFIRASLVTNIAVLVVVCTVLIAFGSSEPVVFAWGPPTAGRGILLSIYFAILANSLLLLWLHARCADKSAVEHAVAALLSTQILYKITTPATAGPANPVAISNLAISALHASTLYHLWRQHKGRAVPLQ